MTVKHDTFGCVKQYMLAIICVAIFLLSVDLNCNARWSIGIIKASEGASTTCTNSVSRSSLRQGVALLFGSDNPASNDGTNSK